MSTRTTLSEFPFHEPDLSRLSTNCTSLSVGTTNAGNRRGFLITCQDRSNFTAQSIVRLNFHLSQEWPTQHSMTTTQIQGMTGAIFSPLTQHSVDLETKASRRHSRP